MTGRSLLPVLTGRADRVHAPEAAIGYELSGNEALFQGDLKLLRNIAPVGDGQWRLYDIVRDPGETRDLAADMPQVFAAMQKAYADYAQSHGVLPMPEGYDPIRQVEINAFFNVYVPRYRTAFWLTMGVLVLMGAWLWRRRRLRRLSRAVP